MSICFIVGHGKSKSGSYDPGATSGGYHEFRIAREIAKYAQAYYNAHYEEQADLLNDSADLYLADRIAKVNASDYDFVAEIHLNASTERSATGTECYYHKGSAIGQRYADAICDAIAAALGVPQRKNGTDADGGDKVKLGTGGRDYFAIIRETGCTATLIETVFITNAADLAKVSTAEGQRKCGEAIARAVAEVRGAKQKPAPVAASSGKLYRVQVGAYSKRENAEAMLQKVKAAGFADAFIKLE